MALASTAGTGLPRGVLACMALPTGRLAFTEGVQDLPELLDRLDRLIRQQGLAQDDTRLRMTGIPNGRARPYLGEIGLVGRAVGTIICTSAPLSTESG